MKFAENGSLLEYIRKQKKQPDYINTMEDETKGLSNLEILRIAHGIAKGMNHLTKVKVRCKQSELYVEKTKRQNGMSFSELI